MNELPRPILRYSDPGWKMITEDGSSVSTSSCCTDSDMFSVQESRYQVTCEAVKIKFIKLKICFLLFSFLKNIFVYCFDL